MDRLDKKDKKEKKDNQVYILFMLDCRALSFMAICIVCMSNS